ncbi:GldG family protein [endosymbiont of Riftia pachyptila]|uniref:Putative ABC-type transport system n=1 Tax=endosymbiont of Riftia pachyptila (vent Ph05) TaxID=1048808 RepID=G2DBB6_9GAMM|nr:DUF4350 domain-containing protein [endosymbiont of Riftia pachyptila]EGV52059.1 putative ABC-type transport system [endosymbiont of Riftia pachyptila (vent Ph05)]
MNIGKQIHQLIFPLLSLALLLLLAWFSNRYQWQWDWTRNGSHTLSETSIALLQRLKGPLQVTIFTPRASTLQQQVERFIERYQRFKPDLQLTFVDPIRNPDASRRQGISLSGELVLRYQGREERLQRLSELHFSNALQRLSQQQHHWIAALTGHGERDLHGKANHDLGAFGQSLQQKGYQLVALTPATVPPDNTALLLIASPTTALLEGELALIEAYLQQGGNLLLLTDPSSRESLQPLLQQLDIEALPGTLVDANVRRLGIDNPTVALVSEYPEFPATAGFDLLTLFPESLALQADQTRDWQVTGLLRTLPQSWNETGPIHGEVERNPELGEQAGPLTIGLALTRQRGEREQRVVVIGDGDFLSNSYLANAGNLDLGLALVGWLAGAEQLIGIPPRPILDRELQLSPLTKGIIGLGALFGLPLLLFSIGGLLGWRRNRA